MSDFHFYEPHLGHGLPHDPFKALVAPRPIGWISTVDANGRVNLAPYSYFNAFGDNPPIVGFSSAGRKDTQRNIEVTGEFVANLATKKHAHAMNWSSAVVPADVDEMQLAMLRPAPSQVVKAPRCGRSRGARMQAPLDASTQRFRWPAHRQHANHRPSGWNPHR
ncbi:MAG TPA: flavin reductase family protein [Tepidisphaeraceae bacterium]|jgi:flavin reductase (DIM6/NTAB) family NADH-FMN oxidoreductase RutF